jgi:hypothetical protein
MIVRHNQNQKSRVKSFFALEAEEKSHLDIKKIQKKKQKKNDVHGSLHLSIL